MGLISRITNPQPGEVVIPIHEFASIVWEFHRGAPGVTVDRIASTLILDAGEVSRLSTWYTTQIRTGNVDRDELEDVLILGKAFPTLYTPSYINTRIGLAD